MRLATTIARAHGEEQFRTVTGPEVGIAEQHNAFKALLVSRSHPDFAEVQLWESRRGRVRQQRFAPPAPETA